MYSLPTARIPGAVQASCCWPMMPCIPKLAAVCAQLLSVQLVISPRMHPPLVIWYVLLYYYIMSMCVCMNRFYLMQYYSNRKHLLHYILQHPTTSFKLTTTTILLTTTTRWRAGRRRVGTSRPVGRKMSRPAS